MPAANRSAGRDVHIYDMKDPDTVLGGLILTNGVTNANLYSMLEIFCIFNSTYFLREEHGMILQRDDHPLNPGNYYILTDGMQVSYTWSSHQAKFKHLGSITISNEPWLVRTISVASGTRAPQFRDAVRERDRRCVLTGQRVPGADLGVWDSFEAAHIFPLAYENHWINNNYSRWITVEPAVGGPINSVQNGMLLRSQMHNLFDNYTVSINPDIFSFARKLKALKADNYKDSYKIVCFRWDLDGVAGKHLDQEFLEHPHRPVDQLLRWHFRQAVFANMREAGEPIFECDFPPGSDNMGEIMCAPKAAERMEFELFSRLVANDRTEATSS